MLKRLSLAFAGLFAFAHVAIAAGTLPGFSLTTQFDQSGKIASGCKLYTIQAGTTSTPQNAYQDSGLSILMPNPMECDASGRLPQFFLADGQIKVRLTNKLGVQLFAQDGLLVVGPSSGGGGGGSVDPTTIMATGDVKARYGSGTLSGFVRLNGRTIGSATSGATERANSDAQALFEFLWNSDSALAVSGGRGVSANADWTANKTLALPDARNRVLAGLGGMGNSDAALFSGYTFTSGDSVTLGSRLGGATTLTTDNLPPYTPAGSISVNTPTWGGPTSRNTLAVTTNGVPNSNYWSGNTPTNLDASIVATWTGTPQGGTSAPFKPVQPTMLVTIYIKL